MAKVVVSAPVKDPQPVLNIVYGCNEVGSGIQGNSVLRPSLDPGNLCVFLFLSLTRYVNQ